MQAAHRTTACHQRWGRHRSRSPPPTALFAQDAGVGALSDPPIAVTGSIAAVPWPARQTQISGKQIVRWACSSNTQQNPRIIVSRVCCAQFSSHASARSWVSFAWRRQDAASHERQCLGSGMTAIRFRQIDEQVTKSARRWRETVAIMTIDAYPEMGRPKQSGIFGGAS